MNYLENLRILRAAVAAQPEEELDLSAWRRDSDFYNLPEPAPGCGTHFCIGGLAAVMPHFRALGLEAGTAGQPRAPSLDLRDEDSTLDHFFKPYPGAPENEGTAYRHIFSTWGAGVWDSEIREHWDCYHGVQPNDKELALARLDRAIAEWEARDGTS
jgi:hypothetical protein